ncbi:hypothetical protein ACQ856_03540 [Mycolicibacterium psychrotolerans]|uniref:hypothetical protein n=1 Tax=Mycolicibacterium psychrotolerans TaxID=216929 RepID=UPI003D675368
MADDPILVQVRRLVDEALDSFDSPGMTVAAIVRKVQRIAVLRHDFAKQIGLIMQTSDIAAAYANDRRMKTHPALVKAREQLATLVGADEANREVDRQMEGLFRTREVESGQVKLLSVSQLEDNLKALERAYDDAEPSSNLNPVDLAYAADKAEQIRLVLLPGLQQERGILGKIRQDMHDYLVLVEMELLAGKATSDIFQRAQSYINASLRRFAPDALEKFVAAQDRLTSGSSEDYAHALTSCRRVIKDLADALYPATGEDVEGVDGAIRTMSDDKYKNRLTEYVRQNVQAKRHKQTVVQIVTDLSSRLNALDGLASKGVHDDVTQAEAETCVVWTYMLAGDIVRIADGTSAFLAPDAS